MAYGWCSAICEGSLDSGDAKELLFLSLEVGFRGLDPQHRWKDIRFTHTKHYQHMANVIFDHGDDGVIGDFLQAWTSLGRSRMLCKSLDMCARHPLNLQHVNPTSKRLRQLVIHAVELVGVQRLGRIRVEEFTALLDTLRVNVDEMDLQGEWLRLIVHVAQYPGGRHSLPRRYLEIMVELVVTGSPFPLNPASDELRFMVSLEEEHDWGMLEFWMGLVWVTQCPSIHDIPEDVERVTLSLFHERPNSIQRLEGWLRRSSVDDPLEYIECLRRICNRDGLEAAPHQSAP